MAGRKNEIAVGILFIGAILILGYFTIIMKDELFDNREYYPMQVVFPSIAGLQVGDKVRVLGVAAGQVESITLKSNQVFVGLKMYEDFELYENYVIKIRAESMITGKYVGITPGTPFTENEVFARLDKNELLSGRESGDVMAMLEDFVADNKDDLRVSIANLRSVSQSFEVTANNLQQITDRINRGEGTVGRLINQDKLYSDTNDLVTELRETIEDTREQAPVTSFIRAALTAF